MWFYSSKSWPCTAAQLAPNDRRAAMLIVRSLQFLNGPRSGLPFGQRLGRVVLFFSNFFWSREWRMDPAIRSTFWVPRIPKSNARDGPTPTAPARGGWRAIQKSLRVISNTTRAFRKYPRPQQRCRISLCACDVSRRPGRAGNGGVTENSPFVADTIQSLAQ
jgi:hypothetical protein